MKTLFKINLVLIVIDLILWITIFFGLLFMIPLGVVQVISSIYILTQRNKISKITWQLGLIHLIISIIIVSALLIVSNGIIELHYEVVDFIMIISMISSGVMAFYFMYVCHLAKNDEKLQLVSKI